MLKTPRYPQTIQAPHEQYEPVKQRVLAKVSKKTRVRLAKSSVKSTKHGTRAVDYSWFADHVFPIRLRELVRAWPSTMERRLRTVAHLTRMTGDAVVVQRTIVLF